MMLSSASSSFYRCFLWFARTGASGSGGSHGAAAVDAGAGVMHRERKRRRMRGTGHEKLQEDGDRSNGSGASRPPS